jgi:hypothetical protein
VSALVSRVCSSVEICLASRGFGLSGSSPGRNGHRHTRAWFGRAAAAPRSSAPTCPGWQLPGSPWGCLLRGSRCASCGHPRPPSGRAGNSCVGLSRWLWPGRSSRERRVRGARRSSTGVRAGSKTPALSLAVFVVSAALVGGAVPSFGSCSLLLARSGLPLSACWMGVNGSRKFNSPARTAELRHLEPRSEDAAPPRASTLRPRR